MIAVCVNEWNAEKGKLKDIGEKFKNGCVIILSARNDSYNHAYKSFRPIANGYNMIGG